jgi:MFS family permease
MRKTTPSADPAPGRSARIPRNIIVLGLVSLFTDASSEMIYPLVPVFVSLLGSGALVLGVIEGVAETTAALVKLASGVLSDRLRKRKVLVAVGYALSSLVRPLTGLVSTAWQIVPVRMTDRVGKGIRTAPRDALIAASVAPSMRGRAFGFHRAMDHGGAVAGPVFALASLVLLAAGFGLKDPITILRWTFGLALIPGLAAVIVAVFFVKEAGEKTSAAARPRFSFRQFDRNFLVYLGILVLFTLGNSSDAFLLLRVEEAVQRSGAVQRLLDAMPLVAGLIGRFGDTGTRRIMAGILLLPLVWAFFHIIKMLFSTPLGALSDRIGRKRVIAMGWAIYALVYTGFALLDRCPAGLQIPATLVLFAVYALYYAFTEGAEKALVADLAGPESRGTAFGMYNFAIGLGALPASVLFGFVYGAWGGTIAFGLGAGLAGTAMILLTAFVRERKPSD